MKVISSSIPFPASDFARDHTFDWHLLADANVDLAWNCYPSHTMMSFQVQLVFIG